MAALSGKRVVVRAAVFASIAAIAMAAPADALAHGNFVPVDKLESAWNAEPAVLAAAGLAFVLFMQAWLRLRARGRTDHASFGRLVTFMIGLALGVLPLVSPLHAIGEDYLLSGHMLEHVLIGDAAVALIVLSVRGPLIFFLLPAFVLAPLVRRSSVRAVLRFLGLPVVALLVWCAVIAVWHVPRLYDATLSNESLHDAEHVLFVFAGLLVWNQLIDPARRGELSRSGRLAMIVTMFAAGQALSSLLLFAGAPLYPAYAFQNVLLTGLTPLADQRLAGAIMMAEQAITLGALGAFLLLSADREQRTVSGART